MLMSVNRPRSQKRSAATFFQDRMSVIVLVPTLLMFAIFVYGFVVWTGIISLSSSKAFVKYDYVGITQYVRLWGQERWHVASINLLIFGVVFIALSIAIGLLLAILLDQRIKGENIIRTICLYPMAMSMIVTGTAWQWLFTPGIGFQKVVNDWGWTQFHLDWLTNPQRSLYTLVVAAVWQGSGFAMALFLAGLRSVDENIIKAARIEGASEFRIYASIVIPMLRPVLMTVVIILSFQAVRSFDLVVALTGGGPGYSSDLPATFMYQTGQARQQMALSAASAVMIFTVVAAIFIPYISFEMRVENSDGE